MLIGILSFVGFKLYENQTSTGNIYAKVTYENVLILIINLETNEYIVYDSIYQNEVDTGRASEGIFYVPGKVTTSMEALYLVDEYARDHQIVGIKLQVENNAISVVYQESPKDLCELQGASDSRLEPIVCLPNDLVIDIYTNLESDVFVPDSVLE